MLSAIEEIRFWTGIMSNHGEFIILSLSYNEQDAIRYAGFYRDRFAGLHEKSKASAAVNDMNTLIALENECINLLTGFIGFKKALLAGMLECRLNSSLPPTFYNHMINEAMEFYKTLTRMISLLFLYIVPNSAYIIRAELLNIETGCLFPPIGHVRASCSEFIPDFEDDYFTVNAITPL